MCRTLLKLSALVIAVQVACACVEQSPDKYASLEFGDMEVHVDGTRATVKCGIRKADKRFTYGFILKNGNDGPDVEIPSRPENGKLGTELEGLTPSDEYSIRAFATNGVNEIFSKESRFAIAVEDTGGEETGGEDTGSEDTGGEQTGGEDTGGEEQGGEDETPGITIPDAEFRSIILGRFDLDGDGQLSEYEAETISTLEFCTDKIVSLEGMEHFPYLERLVCCGSGADNGQKNGRLEKLDLKQNKKLRFVQTDGNNLKELLLPGQSNIEELHCKYNNLESLDLSGCPRLRILQCQNNYLTSIDISTCTHLTELRCANNDLTEGIDVSATRDLRVLSCQNCGIPSIDIGSNKELVELFCNNNYIRDIDLKSNPHLTTLNCSFNLLDGIDVSTNTELTSFNFENNYIREIDLSRNTNLVYLFCTSNQIKKLDFHTLANLKDLWIGGNPISEIPDLSPLPELETYGGNSLLLNDVPDFSHNPKLVNIHLCGTGGARYIDKDFFRNWPDVKEINICQYQGETIDLSLNSKMARLYMADMSNVKVLDLSASPYITLLHLNHCTSLKTLYLNKAVDINAVELLTEGCTFQIEYK